MGEFCENLINWIGNLIVSHNFWSTIVGALIGGWFALRIAKHQVKESEKHQEIQREKIVSHEREMELIRIQLNECNKAIDFIKRLPDLMLEISLLTYEIMEDKEDVMKTRNLKAQTISNISFQLLELESSAKICDLIDGEIEDCRKLKEVTYKMFDNLIEDDLYQQLQNGVSREDFIKSDIENQVFFTEYVNKVNNHFTVRFDNLISKFRRNLS